MGFFTDKCANPECDNRVRKGSKFCNKCGSNAPLGLTKCGKCGTEVATGSKFCFKCGSNLVENTQAFLFDDRWARPDGDFAVRVDDQNVKGWLLKPLIIEHGTRALVFQQGEFKGEMPAGRYDMDGFIQRLANFGFDKNASVVIVDAGDITIDLENDNLYTAEKFKVGTQSRLVLQIENPEQFFVNLFKGRTRISVDEFERQLAGEVQMLLVGICAQYDAEELFANISIRNQIETTLREHLTKTLGRLGMQLVQMRFISFAGEAYEKLRAEKGQLSFDEQQAGLTEDRVKLNMKLRNVLTQDKMDEFRTPKDFENFVRQTEHELGLKQVIRDDEMARLRDRFGFERNRENLLREIELVGIKADEGRRQQFKEVLSQENQADERTMRELQRRLNATTNEGERQKIMLEIQRLARVQKIDLDNVEAERGMDRLDRMNKIDIGRQSGEQELYKDRIRTEQQVEADRLKSRSTATVEALLTIVDGPQGDRITKLEELRRKQNLTPEQMLALASEASPSAAAALAEKYKADGKTLVLDQVKQQLQDERNLTTGYADRMERLMQTALTQMGGVATTRARPVEPHQTVVTQGMNYGGGPVITGPGQQGGGMPQAGPGAAPGAANACKKCGAALAPGSVFCEQCGTKQ